MSSVVTITCVACQEADAVDFRKCSHFLCSACSLALPEPECRDVTCKDAGNPYLPLEDNKRLLPLIVEELPEMELEVAQKVEEELQDYAIKVAHLEQQHKIRLAKLHKKTETEIDLHYKRVKEIEAEIEGQELLAALPTPIIAKSQVAKLILEEHLVDKVDLAGFDFEGKDYRLYVTVKDSQAKFRFSDLEKETGEMEYYETVSTSYIDPKIRCKNILTTVTWRSWKDIKGYFPYGLCWIRFRIGYAEYQLYEFAEQDFEPKIDCGQITREGFKTLDGLSEPFKGFCVTKKATRSVLLTHKDGRAYLIYVPCGIVMADFRAGYLRIMTKRGGNKWLIAPPN
jgi:hypothetical protein